MPNYRNVSQPPRRSRRLSHQEPKCYDEDGFECYDPQIIARFSSESSSSSCSTPSLDKPLSISLAKPHSAKQSPKSSHSRRRDEAHIPRPPNAFILFRSDFWESQKEDPIERDHRQISRLAANLWKEASDTTREYYRKQAVARKKEHAVQYPNYKYAPTARREKAVRRKPAQDRQAEIERCEELASRLIRGQRLEAIEEYNSATLPSSREGSVLVKAESPQPQVPRDLESSPCPSDEGISEARIPSSPPNLSSEAFDDDCTLMYPDTPEEFVALEDIPPLDLAADLAAPKNEQLEVTIGSHNDSPQPPSYNRVGSQFGFKPQVLRVQAEQIMLSDSALVYDEPGWNSTPNFSTFLPSEETRSEYSLYKPEELGNYDLLSISGYTSTYQTLSYGQPNGA